MVCVILVLLGMVIWVVILVICVLMVFIFVMRMYSVFKLVWDDLNVGYDSVNGLFLFVFCYLFCNNVKGCLCYGIFCFFY